MKLILCEECLDIFSLQSRMKICHCGKSKGRYINSLNAKITGPCIPLGFANASFVNALHLRPKSGMGSKFDAFVIPEECATVDAG
jgi:hypothetical protein